MARSIIIVGVGHFVSLSLAAKLASIGWRIALISRSLDKLTAVADDARRAGGKDVVVKCKLADAGDPLQLWHALDWAKEELGTVDCLCFNAARVDMFEVAPSLTLELEGTRDTPILTTALLGSDNLMTDTPEGLDRDFRTSVIGTLGMGQWFANYCREHPVHAENGMGEPNNNTPFPLFLVTAGLLEQTPDPAWAPLSAVKSASYDMSVKFAQVLEKKCGIKVGIPIIAEPIIPREADGHVTTSDSETIVNEIFMPFLEWDGREGKEWVRDRAW